MKDFFLYFMMRDPEEKAPRLSDLALRLLEKPSSALEQYMSTFLHNEEPFILPYTPPEKFVVVTNHSGFPAREEYLRAFIDSDDDSEDFSLEYNP